MSRNYTKNICESDLLELSLGLRFGKYHTLTWNTRSIFSGVYLVEVIWKVTNSSYPIIIPQYCCIASVLPRVLWPLCTALLPSIWDLTFINASAKFESLFQITTTENTQPITQGLVTSWINHTDRGVMREIWLHINRNLRLFFNRATLIIYW